MLKIVYRRPILLYDVKNVGIPLPVISGLLQDLAESHNRRGVSDLI